MRAHRTRSPRLRAGLVAVLGGAVLALWPVAAGAQSDPARVTVTPDTALEDGDRVDVVGTGFTPGSTVFLLLCNGDTRLGDELGRCSVIGAGSTGYTVDATGRFEARQVAIPVGQVGATAAATCPPTAAQAARGVSCSVEVATADLAAVAGISITYRDQPTAQGPTELAFTGAHDLALASAGAVAVVLGVALVLAGRRLDADAVASGTPSTV